MGAFAAVVKTGGAVPVFFRCADSGSPALQGGLTGGFRLLC